ncbi:ABC transporter permease [Alkaliphilus hydrothermalis]|uniref:Transport permease protein n=1 Tax=Alkaliphilus hydrothermalis TaxID=1482730 RepID=A0ABS2NTD7_9FIRM|nr:ABC transporter permease [Alkaliphilus hydrothermalis]MBM7616198.1 ABC-2 type transport system permease protein [Alkaliphilus hydrothermalis]
MGKIVDRIQSFVRQSMLSFKSLFAWLDPKIYILVKVINPALQLMFFCILLSYVYKTDDLTPWVIGNAFILCTFNAMFGVGITLIAERFYGTLKMVIVSPTNSFVIFFARAFFHVLDASITVIVGLVVGFIFFNFRIPIENIPIFTLTLLCCMYAAACLGLLVGSFGLLVTDINMLLNIASMMLLFFSGANFPIDRLPVVLQKISYALPMTRSIEAGRLVASQGPIEAISKLIFMEFIVGTIYLVIGYVVLKILERVAYKNATLEVY